MTKKERTYALAQMQIVEPSEELRERVKANLAVLDEKAVATEQASLLNFALENKQEDLTYFKAIYATCGFNLNDDVFVNEEFWKARKSPVLKPTNWQHKDSEILGVIYAVAAQTLDGTPLDIESEKTPEDDFEIVVHGVIYKYTFPERAENIEERSKAGELFVSMEAWFSEFAYAILENDSQNMKVVARNEETVALDQYLRCRGGTGYYEGQRIGRVLKELTFGGMGIVDQPANPRSGGVTHDLLEETKLLEIPMADKAELKQAVAEEVEQREAAKAAEAHLASLETKASELEVANATLTENLDRAAKKAERADMQDAVVGAIEKALDEAIAGLGDTPPEEIAKIDNADTADAKFAAKLAWLTKAASNEEALATLTEENETLKAKLAEFEAVKAEAEKAALVEARTAQVRELLEDADEEAVEKIIAKLVELDEEAYAERIEEYRVFAAKPAPTVRHDGAQGSPDEEGASGESKAESGPREDRKISVEASLEEAVVEETVEPEGNANAQEIVSPMSGLADVVVLNKKNKKE